MQLHYVERDKINYWDIFTMTIDEDIFDIVNINYGILNIQLSYKFKRHKNFCFYESFRDYGFCFVKDLEFVELKDYLYDHNESKQLIYFKEEFLYDGP